MQPGLFNDILVQFGLMMGFAAVVSLLVNVGKKFGIVKDGTADKWVAGFNLIGVVALYVARLVVPDFNPIVVDNALGEVALIGGYIFGFVAMLVDSKVTYFASKGLPVIGTSYSKGSQVIAVVSSPTESPVK